jgi:hypothetical protein
MIPPCPECGAFEICSHGEEEMDPRIKQIMSYLKKVAEDCHNDGSTRDAIFIENIIEEIEKEILRGG